ncbi:MAG: gamma-glutamyl-gamma-aminobutyrate hydrolase family protein [Actinomycetota bacterium]|nr:gamma-glutamyl-gamma-aminobutyrate hydrolase family protein [Actinomycetota bacterium]
MDTFVTRDRRPLIGVAAAEVRPAETIRRVREGEPLTHETTIGLDYITGIADAEAVPVVLPVTDPETTCLALERVDALCLPGGPDLDPSFYGAERTSCIGPSQLEVDRFQLALARAAVEGGMPILAICRGMQVLNVALGGSLIPHLPDHPGATLPHRQDAPGNIPGHPVRLAPESLLADLLGTDSIDVNTFHHQAIDEPGSGLTPVAWSADSVVEAVEIPDRDFVLGLQWHAELMLDGEVSRVIFNGFTEAARDFGRRGPVPRRPTERTSP